MFRKTEILSLVVLFFLALLLTTCGKADKAENTFYVALNGSDSNPGTLDKPWATINHAAEVLKAGGTVYVRGGTYRVTQQIRAKNSGTESAWIVYSSYPGEQAILDANNVKVGSPVGGPPFPHDQGAFQVERVSYIRIKNLKITNSHNAGFTVRDSHHIELYNNLNSNSPAIDKGSPEKTYSDPDGTRNDIGAFSYGTEQSFWWKKNFPPQFDVGTSNLLHNTDITDARINTDKLSLYPSSNPSGANLQLTNLPTYPVRTSA